MPVTVNIHEAKTHLSKLYTHTFLWWIINDPRLSPRVHEIISDGSNTILLSAASGWEIAIKAQIGRLRLPFDRTLVAQSQLEDVTILTMDSQIARYPVKVIW